MAALAPGKFTTELWLVVVFQIGFWIAVFLDRIELTQATLEWAFGLVAVYIGGRSLPKAAQQLSFGRDPEVDAILKEAREARQRTESGTRISETLQKEF